MLPKDPGDLGFPVQNTEIASGAVIQGLTVLGQQGRVCQIRRRYNSGDFPKIFVQNHHGFPVEKRYPVFIYQQSGQGSGYFPSRGGIKFFSGQLSQQGAVFGGGKEQHTVFHGCDAGAFQIFQWIGTYGTLRLDLHRCIRPVKALRRCGGNIGGGGIGGMGGVRLGSAAAKQHRGQQPDQYGSLHYCLLARV